MPSNDVLKVNDTYLIKLLKDKFQCNISVVPSNKHKMFYPCFAFEDTPCIGLQHPGTKREALYTAASLAINKLIEEDKISNNDAHYYDDTFHKLFNGQICYS